MKKIFLIVLIFILSPSVYSGTPDSTRTRVDWVKGSIISENKNRIAINDNGKTIDYETGNIISYSFARDISFNKSKENALLGAVNLINEIQIDPGTKIKDLIIRDRNIRLKISQYLHEYATYKENSAGYIDTSCTIELKLGYLIDAIGINFPEEHFPQRDDIDISTKYTSMIIDTRGLKIKPLLLPSIVNETGLEIYSRNNISGKDAVRHLAVSYTYSEIDAFKHKKAGSHPFFCTALKALNGNPVVSDDDTKRFFSHKDNLTFLKKCRVIFIIDR